jgi:hypothetical protein
MDHDFDTALRALLKDDRPDPRGTHLTDDRKLGLLERLRLLETLWEELKKDLMGTAAEIREALNPGAEKSWREANIRRLENGEETAGLDLRDVGVKLARMADMTGSDYVRVEFMPRCGSGGPPAVRLQAVRDFGGGNIYHWNREFTEAELISMRKGLPKYAVDVFCHDVREQFKAAEEELKHGNG